MSGRGDYHGVRSGEKRKAETDEATLGVAPKLPRTKTEKDTYASHPPPFARALLPVKMELLFTIACGRMRAYMRRANMHERVSPALSCAIRVLAAPQVRPAHRGAGKGVSRDGQGRQQV
jgi:hypothetical protein